MHTLPYLDPLIPLHEDVPAKLARLSSNIETLTRLLEDAQRHGLEHLTVMFTHSRQRKVDEALSCLGTTNHDV